MPRKETAGMLLDIFSQDFFSTLLHFRKGPLMLNYLHAILLRTQALQAQEETNEYN